MVGKRFMANCEGILKQICQYKSIEIIEAHAIEHIHMLLKIPLKLAEEYIRRKNVVCFRGM